MRKLWWLMFQAQAPAMANTTTSRTARRTGTFDSVMRATLTSIKGDSALLAEALFRADHDLPDRARGDL